MSQPRGSQPASRRRVILALGVLATTASLIQIPSLGVAPDWIEGDYAHYVMHAGNLVEGRPFEATGYIYNPNYPSLAPRAYPPGYPLLLAPVYAASGGELVPMRLLTLCFFAGSLILMGLLFHSHLPASFALVGVALVGFNPEAQKLALQVSSDVPFLFFLLWSLIALEARSAEDSVRRSLLLGVLLFIPFSIRTVGGVLPVALVCSSLWRFRRVDRNTLISLGCFATLVAVLSFWTAGSASYVDQLRPSLATFLSNTVAYSRDFSAFWDPASSQTVVGERLRKIFTIFAMTVITVGLWSRVRAGATTKECFVVLYVLLVLAWPAYQGARFLVPVFPLACLYLLLGARAVADRVRSVFVGRATFVLSTIVPLVFYAASYVFPADTAERLAVDDAPSEALFAFLRETPDDAVLVFAKPRVLALMTGRRAVANHQPERDEDLLVYLEEVGATYVILGPEALGRRAYLEGFLERNASVFNSVFVNERFAVYRLLD